jgi:hypothetical protein
MQLAWARLETDTNMSRDYTVLWDHNATYIPLENWILLHLHGFTTVLCWFEELNGIKLSLHNNVRNQHRRQSIN